MPVTELLAEAAKVASSQVKITALAGMAAVVILCGGLLVFVWMVGQATRRYGDSKRLQPPARYPRPTPDEDDWARKPLVPPLQDDDAPVAGFKDGRP